MNTPCKTPKLKHGVSLTKGRKGTPNKRIIKEFVRDGRMCQLHATKGWRSYRSINNHTIIQSQNRIEA